ncbi:MAG: RDD family protein [Homoserinimonas sp.]
MPTATTQPTGATPRWPGERFGLPQSGPRSVARPGRRIAALAIDFLLAALLSAAFFQYSGIASTIIFAVTQVVFITLVAGGIGHLIVGLRVVPIAGGWIGWWRPVVRTLLICAVVPPLIWDSDQRGLHDKLAGTVLVRR